MGTSVTADRGSGTDFWGSARFRLLSGLMAVGLVVGFAVSASAGHGTSSVTSYTGCRNLSGGNIVKLAEGDSPMDPCASNQALVHFSSGDITTVSTGAGLTGGGTNGAVEVALAATHALPQGCTDPNILPKWNGSLWACAPDNDTTYTAGTGLQLGGSANEFSVLDSYRMPQSCTASAVPKWDATASGWACGTDNDTTYDGGDFALSNQSCPTGHLVQGINHLGGLNCPRDSGASPYVAQAKDTLFIAPAGVRAAMRVTVPPGIYLIWAKLDIFPNLDALFGCELKHKATDTPDVSLDQVTTRGDGVIALMAPVHVTTERTIQVDCSADKGGHFEERTLFVVPINNFG